LGKASRMSLYETCLYDTFIRDQPDTRHTRRRKRSIILLPSALFVLFISFSPLFLRFLHVRFLFIKRQRLNSHFRQMWSVAFALRRQRSTLSFHEIIDSQRRRELLSNYRVIECGFNSPSRSSSVIAACTSGLASQTAILLTR